MELTYLLRANDHLYSTTFWPFNLACVVMYCARARAQRDVSNGNGGEVLDTV